MSTPKRIQMSRQHPWRAENPDAVIVARPSKWGNPFAVVKDGYGYAVKQPGHATVDPRTHRDTKAEANVLAVEFYKVWLCVDSFRLDLSPVHGKDLACWCGTGVACHGDVLLEIANRERA